MQNLAGRIAVVTGASRGVGKGVALGLGEAGATVYVTGRTVEEPAGSEIEGTIQQTADEVTRLGGKGLDLSNSESPQFIGRAVAAIASDPNVLQRTGQALIAAELGVEYGFTDIDGKQPRPISI